MIERNVEVSPQRAAEIAQWTEQLQDESALLDAPGARHKVLLHQAYALHQQGVINSDDLSDLLEQADGALAYAVEALFDRQARE